MPSLESEKSEIWDDLLHNCKSNAERVNMELMISAAKLRMNTDLARGFLTNGSPDVEKITSFMKDFRIPDDMKERSVYVICGFLNETAEKKIDPAKLELKNDRQVWADLRIALMAELQPLSNEVVKISSKIENLRSNLRFSISSLIVDGRISDKRIHRMVECCEFRSKARQLVIRAVRKAVEISAASIEN